MTNDLSGLALLWRQAKSFVLVGLAATLVHFAAMGLLISQQWTSPLAATFVGSLLGSVVAYLANRRLTFQSDAPHRRALLRHYVVVAASIILNAIIFRAAHQSFALPVWFSQGLATGLCMVFNFIASRFWVFRSS
jgi:putative flippase GtrA